MRQPCFVVYVGQSFRNVLKPKDLVGFEVIQKSQQLFLQIVFLLRNNVLVDSVVGQLHYFNEEHVFSTIDCHVLIVQQLHMSDRNDLIGVTVKHENFSLNRTDQVNVGKIVLLKFYLWSQLILEKAAH